MHCEPNFRAASATNSGRWTAAVLIETLSAPAISSLRMSSTVRTPPPTVSGMKHLLRRPVDHAEQRVPVLVRGGDVEEAELVRALLVVDPRLLDGIAGIDQIDEVDALDGASVLDVETGDDARLEHSQPDRMAMASAGSIRPS